MLWPTGKTGIVTFLPPFAETARKIGKIGGRTRKRTATPLASARLPPF